ncbi:D-sedoheptulose-7-phosphate isomerase [Dictyobacter aurantiacus]|uniref:Phosphoheptose isomerase n=1 Tax=Dictyobacter aurantiacus TaxID=1936993 RepID=A0A401Z7G8_9CHLR|nr:SIS domain-containing protein [Dictyobacter aurantiacus]GCE02756.1 phosphoheptose isomerase [Dictyobacter aurantiacus]
MMYVDIQRYWQELTDACETIPLQKLNQVAEVLFSCYQRDNTIFLMGNGGSAATASHFACDLTKGTKREGMPAIRALALNENVALMTAWANDTHYTRIFAEQIAALLRADDAIIVISTSGQSPNILQAAHKAQQQGAMVIALTGCPGGELVKLADVSIQVAGHSIEQVEDLHLIVAHSLCVALRKRLDEAATMAPVASLGKRPSRGTL